MNRCRVSHLTTLRNDDIQIRDIPTTTAGLGGLHLLDYIHAFGDLAEDHVLAVEEGRGHGRDEELGAVAVRTGVLSMRVLAGLLNVRSWAWDRHTAMDRRPSCSCFRLKFSSLKALVP